MHPIRGLSILGVDRWKIAILLTLGIVFVACDMSAFLYFGSMYLIRLRMEPSCSMEVVRIAGKYGI